MHGKRTQQTQPHKDVEKKVVAGEQTGGWVRDCTSRGALAWRCVSAALVR